MKEDISYFHDIETGEYHPVVWLDMMTDPTTLCKSLDHNHWYIVGDTVYPFLDVTELSRRASCEMGGIYIMPSKDGPKIRIRPWRKDVQDRYSINNLVPENYSEKTMQLATDPNLILGDYVDAYMDGRNLSKDVKVKDTSTGALYIPKFRDEDNVVERLLKRIIIAMKVVSSEYRKKMPEDYKYDNLVSSLDGATKHTSIIKVLEWFQLLELDWEFMVFNSDHDLVQYPLPEPVVISNKDGHWVDIDPEPYAPGIFLVPLVDGEDPYKRLIKLALYGKMIPKSVYRKKGATNHQINNLMSALRNKQKMASEYFEIWCEILELEWKITLTDPVTGIWYSAIGYDISTNYEEDD